GTLPWSVPTTIPDKTPPEKREVTTTDSRKLALLKKHQLLEEPTPVKLPPAAKVGAKVRFVMVTLGTTPLATIADFQEGKLDEIATTIPVAYGSGVDVSLQVQKIASQPDALALKTGTYYCVSTFVRKDKKQLPGPVLFATQPL